MNATLRVALVGAGIADRHAAAWRWLPALFDVPVLCSLDDARGRALCDRHRIAEYTQDVDSLFERHDIDIVDICTPPDSHFALCERALAAGKHVVCEKPLFGSLAEVDRMASLVQRSGRLLMPIFQYRFAPGIARMKAAVDAGLCGALRLATSETSWLRGDDYYAAPWRGTFAGEGGGAVLGHGTHAHDLLSFVAGPLVSISGQVATLVNDIETEDTATGFGAVADGGLVSMAVTLGSIREITRLRFSFEHVSAESSVEPYEPGNEPWTFDWASAELAAEADALWASMPETSTGFSGQLAAFHHAVTTDGDLPVTLADARRALELVTGWYESARTGRPVELSGR